MNLGDSGSDVGSVQSLLTSLNYSILESETSKTFFGPSTELSVKQFQQSNSLVSDGIVGPNTNRVLIAEASAVNNPVLSITEYTRLLLLCKVEQSTASAWGPSLYEAMVWKKIIFNRNEVCSFTANVLHETGLLTMFEENLNYSSTALLSLFPTHFTVQTATTYGRGPAQPANQRMIANIAYSNRMGNGPPETDDGWNRKGRGPFQLTGTSNYLAFAKDSSVDVIKFPTQLTQPEAGSKSAAWFWTVNKCGPAARSLDYETVCKKINGGMNGAAHRKELTEFLLSKLTGV